MPPVGLPAPATFPGPPSIPRPPAASLMPPADTSSVSQELPQLPPSIPKPPAAPLMPPVHTSSVPVYDSRQLPALQRAGSSRGSSRGGWDSGPPALPAVAAAQPNVPPFSQPKDEERGMDSGTAACFPVENWNTVPHTHEPALPPGITAEVAAPSSHHPQALVCSTSIPVSYTHLTLPTILLV